MKQSIVTWRPFPDNGVEGLPEKARLILQTVNGIALAGFVVRLTSDPHLTTNTGEKYNFDDHPQITHYALADDLERDSKIDMKAVGDAAYQAGMDHAKEQSAEDHRVRWLVEQITRCCERDGISIEAQLDFVLRAEEAARAQVERERAEGWR